MYDEWGISDGYFDVAGSWHHTSEQTRAQIRAAMGDPYPGPPLWFVAAGEAHQLLSTCCLILEDGTDRGSLNELPGDLPLGYHDLVPNDGGPTTRLIVHPSASHPVPRAWGVAAQIYALWSKDSWGIGDLNDLRELATRVYARGGRVILTSPLHQPAPALPQEASPYYPSTRRCWNPLLLSIDQPPPSRLSCDAHSLVQRDTVWQAKREVLEQRFEVWPTPPGLPTTAAIWNAICDQHGPHWQTWPTTLRRSDRHVLAQALADDPTLARRATFHQWCQERVAEQLQQVAETGIQLIGDLAVGFSPSGADAWEYQQSLALGMRIGAPPDPFSADGQDWGIPPFIPWRLRNQLYQPFILTLRACLQGVAGIRIDHIMGLFRQYWVPAGEAASKGAYVLFPSHELLAIVCLEAVRANAFVVGEDLGTVEPHVRDVLAERNIAGTRVAWFESDKPSLWPESCLASVTTHDLPTIAGVLAEGDGNPLSQRLRSLSAASAPIAVIDDVHQAVLNSPAKIRLLSLDDVCAATEQANLPGTIGGANWSRRLPKSVDDLPRFGPTDNE